MCLCALMCACVVDASIDNCFWLFFSPFFLQPLGGGKFVFNKGYEQTGEYIVADATDEQEDVSDTLHSHQQCLEQDTHTHTRYPRACVCNATHPPYLLLNFAGGTTKHALGWTSARICERVMRAPFFLPLGQRWHQYRCPPCGVMSCVLLCCAWASALRACGCVCFCCWY